MMDAMKNIGLAGMVGVLLLAAGCVEREEKITVREKGDVTITLLMTADSEEELYPGRVPSAQAGWSVQQSRTTKSDGQTDYLLAAEKSFPAGAALPSTCAEEEGMDRDLYLQFPTSVSVEEREDGRYYHFRRVYKGRPRAFIELLKEMFANKDTDQLLEEGLDTLTPEKRLQYIRDMARVEVHKMLTFARAAFLQVSPDSRQDQWLQVQAQALKVLDRVDYDKIADLVGMGQDSEMRDQALVTEGKLFEESVHQSLHQGLVKICAYSPDQCRDFKARYARKEKLYRITEDLGCEYFDITLELPGEILGANLGAEVEGNRVSWAFTGKMIWDRDLEIMASSRLAP